MFHESFPQGNANEQECTEPQKQVSAESPELSGATAEHEQYGWNDVIIADDDQEAAEKVINDLGFAYETKVLSAGQYLDVEKHSGVPGQILLSITYRTDKNPVDRETLRQIMVALRENEKKHIAVRVARLAPGEHFG